MTNNWSTVSLAAVSGKPQYGVIASGSDTPIGPLLVRQTDITSGRVDWSSVPYCDLSSSDIAKYALRQGDLLISRLGNGVGNAATILEARDDAVFAGYLVRFQPDPEVANPVFVGYQLQSNAWRAHVSSFRSGAAQPTLNAQQMGEFEFLLPPLEEQRAIAATLGALGDKIESNRRAIGVMEELARSTFEQIFDLEQVDDGVALSELVNVNPRRVLRSGTPATYVGMSSLPEFSAEVYKWETREAGSGQRFVLGDVLMARITPCLENGKTAVVDMLQPDEVGWGSTEYVVLSPTGLLSTAWIYCLVRDERIRDFAIRSMTGTSGRQRFQADRFSQYRIAPPESVDLVRFNALAEPLFTRMTQLRDEGLKLSALRDALLPELLSGRVRTLTEARP